MTHKTEGLLGTRLCLIIKIPGELKAVFCSIAAGYRNTGKGKMLFYCNKTVQVLE